MKKFGKLVVCFLLVFASILFVGCSKITLTTTLSANGKITTLFEVDLKDVQEQKKTLYNIFSEYYNQLEKQYEKNLVYYFSFVYDSEIFDELNFSQKVDYVLKRNPHYLAGDSEMLTTQTVDITGYNYFYVKKDFASIYAYLMYFCPSAFTFDAEENKVKISSDYHSLIDVPMASKDGDIVEEGNIFIKQYIQDFCPFYYNNEEPKFFEDKTFFSITVREGETLSQTIIDNCGFTQEEVDYHFNFATPYKRLHSSGLTQMTTSGYTHSWSLGSVNSKIEVWRNYANYLPWYCSVIIICLVGLIISLIVVKIIMSNRKKKGMMLLRKVDEFETGKKEKK